MNKQKAIEKIEKLKGLTIKDKDFNFDIEMIPKGEALEIVNRFDEPEKPVVPKFIAEWIEDHKENYIKWDEEARADFVFRAINDLFRFGEGLNPWVFTIYEEFSKWTTENTYEFITAILFDYTVEKEKLYTAMLKISGEYLRLDCNGNFGHYKADREYILGVARVFQFTEDDLVKYHIWGNDNYEVKEVEK
ncbi:DUF1642 domain-containing protein [Streptococcus infantarius]|uniref:DUF1642 domain-containing protein n=1 Tax=Streptococcus infantarius TaxID=102684 RepID=UPI0022E32327|nr:DUF1642 domain-containing protein [Streptococcus infantarius]